MDSIPGSMGIAKRVACFKVAGSPGPSSPGSKPKLVGNSYLFIFLPFGERAISGAFVFCSSLIEGPCHRGTLRIALPAALTDLW